MYLKDFPFILRAFRAIYRNTPGENGAGRPLQSGVVPFHWRNRFKLANDVLKPWAGKILADLPTTSRTVEIPVNDDDIIEMIAIETPLMRRKILEAMGCAPPVVRALDGIMCEFKDGDELSDLRKGDDNVW